MFFIHNILRYLLYQHNKFSFYDFYVNFEWDFNETLIYSAGILVFDN